jgi:3D (Asp-Asp-Asp) domain-containing protein
MVSAAKSLFLFLSLAFVTSAAHAAAIDDLPPNLKKVGDLRPTFYWVALEANDGQAKTNTLLDVDGNVLAKVSNKFLTNLRMEGTGKLADGRIINFAPYGYGLQDFALKPFHSVAVDPTVIPIPSRVYIPAAKGAVLPDGTIHDGYFEAVDIGDAIQNQRVDVFTSYGDQSQLFEHHGFTNMTATAVYRVME